MKLIYNLFINLLIFGMKIGALFNYKIKKGLAGRRQSCEIVQSKLSKDKKVIWMHAASLGEYLQGLPVLEKLKQEFPHHQILVTFFSPSGYENVINKPTIADAICYLPFDKKKWINEFTSHFETEIFFTVKYDYWYNLLNLLKKKGVKIYVISAYFYETQVFFKPYGNWFVSNLKRNIDWFFHQTQGSSALAKGLGLINSSTSGDTRYDKVKQNLERDNHIQHILAFKEGKKTFVFGSSWEAEERIAELLYKKYDDMKFIIAPHDLNRVEHLKKIFPKDILYSSIADFDENPDSINLSSQVLIIDSIGLLSKLYAYGDIAIVGGGFHTAGLHNILEAAVFGIPVFFGNHYQKNPEADELLLHKGGSAFEDEFATADYIEELLKNPDLLESMGYNAAQFILSQPNAAEYVVKRIIKQFPNHLTN